eukprot:10200825-Ditylum_brightwellii.AAC.1
MEIADVETETVNLNTPDLSDEEVWSDDENESQWDEETVVLDELLVTLLNTMENNLSFFLGEILLRFFTPQENIITARAA